MYIMHRKREKSSHAQRNTGNKTLSSYLAESSVLGHLVTEITACFLMTQPVSCYPDSQTLSKFQNQQESALHVIINSQTMKELTHTHTKTEKQKTKACTILKAEVRKVGLDPTLKKKPKQLFIIEQMEASKDTATSMAPPLAVVQTESLSFVNCVGICYITTRLG